MRQFYSILFVAFIVSCTKDQRPKSLPSITAYNAQEEARIKGSALEKNLNEVSIAEVHPMAKSWSADIYLVNFNLEQESKVLKAVQIIKKVIASKEFKDRILNYEYDGKKQFFENAGLSNEQIYQKILEGAEQMGNTGPNNTMDVELELYTQATTTIGYTYPNTVRIWMNKKYFNKYTPINVADNLMHEWMHKLGFVHAIAWSKSRDHSVPYAIGYLVEELAEKYNQ